MLELSEEDVKHWMRKIHLSLAWRKPYEKTWDRVIDCLKGRYFDTLEEEDLIYVNMVHPHVRVVIPAIYSRNPDVIVRPMQSLQFEDDVLIQKRAELMQRVIRYYFKQLDVKTEVKLCILDAVLAGHAWAKTGYETQFEKIKEQAEERRVDNSTFISDLLIKMGIKEAPKQTNSEDENENYLNEKITYEQPWVLRTSIYDMIVPALSRRPEELPWIAERIICPYEEVMDEDDYDTRDLKPSANANELLSKLRGASYKNLGYANELKYVIKYEVWDGKSQSVFTLAEDHPRPLEIKDSEYTFLDSRYHPYLQLRFNEVPDEFYPVGDIEPAEPQLEELSEVRTQQNTHRKRYNRKYTTRPGALEPQAKADLEAGEDGTIIEVSQSMDDKPLADILAPVIDAALPPEVYAVESRVRDDIFTILGTSDYASQSSGGARTATEASIIATQSRFRVEERIDLVGNFVNRIIRNLGMISQRYMGVEQIKKLVGRDAIFWIQQDINEDIRGEFLFDIIYASTAPVNREVDREQYSKFYATAVNDSYYNQIKLRIEYVRKYALDDPESWLDPKIIKIIEQQRMIAAKQGFLLEGATNAPQSRGRVPRPNARTGVERLPTGQPQGLPGDGGQTPVPGGMGGTNLA